MALGSHSTETTPEVKLPAAVEVDGEVYVRAAPGYSPVKGSKPHVTEKPNLLHNKIYESVVDSLPSLVGKCVAITGSTSGTGYWAAMAACKKEAKALLLLNRKSARSKIANEEIIAAAGESTTVHQVECDLMSFESVRTAAAEVGRYAEQYGGLDVLACNAGIMMMPDDRTEDGYDLQMQVDHLSHALLMTLLQPSLEAAAASRGEARIVAHSACVRFGPLKNFGGKHFTKCPAGSLGGNGGTMSMLSFMGPQATRYFHAKLANSCYAMALHGVLQAKGSKVKSLAAEPGLASTSLLSNGWEISAGKKASPLMMMNMIPLMKLAAQTGADGACPLIMASFSSEANSGDMYCPKGTFMLPPLGKVYTKGMPFLSIVAGKPFKKGKEKRSVNLQMQQKCWAATEAAVGAFPGTPGGADGRIVAGEL